MSLASFSSRSSNVKTAATTVNQNKAWLSLPHRFKTSERVS